MNEAKGLLAIVALIISVISHLKKDYEWSRYFALISIIISMSV